MLPDSLVRTCLPSDISGVVSNRGLTLSSIGLNLAKVRAIELSYIKALDTIP